MANEVAERENKGTITDQVLNRVNALESSGMIKIPSDYSPENALKSAWLILQDVKTGKEGGYKPVLEVCTPKSIANTLFDMVVQGLNPMKKQCYFIPYGKSLSLSRSYMGTIAVAKKYGNVKKVDAFVIYEGDDFEFEIDAENGTRKIVKHKQSLENFDGEKIKGAYAVVQFEDDQPNYIEIMSINQIKKSWSKAKSDGVQKAFPEEMAKRTVINRALKLIINTSDDGALYEDEDYSREEKTVKAVENEIEENANQGEEIGFDDTDNIIDENEINQENVIPVEEASSSEIGGQMVFEPGF